MLIIAFVSLSRSDARSSAMVVFGRLRLLVAVRVERNIFYI